MNRTTLCQVGATTGVALLEGSRGVNKFVLGKTAFGWILTLIIAGIGAGLVVAQGVHAPLAGAYDVPDTPQVRILTFTRYCNDQYCMVYGLLKGGRGGVVYCAIAVQ